MFDVRNLAAILLAFIVGMIMRCSRWLNGLFLGTVIFLLINIAQAAESIVTSESVLSENPNLTSVHLKNSLPLEQLLSFRDEEGNTMLHLALKDKDNELAEEILAMHPELIDTENSKHESPIYLANKYNNLEGVKLCFEYHPKTGSATKSCPIIYEKVKGTEPYHLKKTFVQYFQPEDGQNQDKLVVILNLPDHKLSYLNANAAPNTLLLFNYFKKNNIPVLVIGNKKHSLTDQLLRQELEKIIMPEKILVIINGHGHINQAGNHAITFDNLEYKSETKDLFLILNSIFNKPISVLLSSCHGLGASKNVDLLPSGSALLVLTQADKTVNGYEFLKMFLKFELNDKNRYFSFDYKEEDYQHHPERFSLEYFLQSYLASLEETNNIPELTVSHVAKEFDYIELQRYLGHLPTEEQQRLIVARFKNFCRDQLECGKSVQEAIDKIEEADDLTDKQRQEIVKTLQEYCQQPQDCEKTVKVVIDQIGAAKEIKDLYAPVAIKQKYMDMLAGFYAPVDGDPHKELCSNKPNKKIITDEEFLESFPGSDLTDYNLCKRGHIDFSSISRLCLKTKPSKPTFGMALSILYAMKKIEEQNIAKDNQS